MRERVERRVPKERAERERERVEAELAKLGLSRHALPRRWSTRVRLGVLHVLGLLRVELAMLRAKASGDERAALRADAREGLVRVLLEENGILRRRLESIEPRRRPHYTPEDRLKILELRAAQGWTLEYTAARFLVSVMTLTTWMKRIDEAGPTALLRAEPVNKYPQLVTRLVVVMGLASPLFGSRRIAQLLGRLGLVLSASTVRRRRKEKIAAPVPPGPSPAAPIANDDVEQETPAEAPTAKTRAPGSGVTSKHEHHVWHVDLTWLSFSVGDWVAWIPYSVPKIWLFVESRARMKPLRSAPFTGLASRARLDGPPRGPRQAPVVPAEILTQHGRWVSVARGPRSA